MAEQSSDDAVSRAEHEAEIERIRRLVKAASCRCAAQIAGQRIENRQRAALTKLLRMDLPPKAAEIVAQALYDQGHPEPSPAPYPGGERPPNNKPTERNPNRP